MYFATVLSICLLFVATCNADPVGRLAGGQQVDNLRQFPHHVYIVPFESGRKCGGSILNAQWVLTSAECLMDSIRLDLHFGKKNEYDHAAAYYTISVNRDQVFVYPTDYDDLALVKLPTRLVFSESISPVTLSKLPIEILRNRFAVMPGFNDLAAKSNASAPAPPSRIEAEADNLKYGMFNVLENTVCKESLGSREFNEYTQLCTVGWGTNPDTPCDSDLGSGLIIGWPAKSELIGIFSMYSSKCDLSRPAVYTYVAKYAPWIESMIQG